MKKYLLAVTVLTGSLSFAQVTSGLVSRYNFSNGNAFDLVGSNHGTVVGATLTADRFGIANMAYNFDGVSNYIIIPDNATNNLNTMSDITISAWIKPGSVTSGLRSIVSKWNNSTSEQYALYQNGTVNTTGIRVVNSVGTDDASNYSAGNWYHVAFSYNKTTNQHLVYVNGVQTLTFTPGGSYANSTDVTSLSIGAQVNDFNGGAVSPNRFFEGAIDDVSIYNKVLSSTEVDSLYNAEVPSCFGFSVNVTQNNAATSGSNGSIGFLPNGGQAPYSYTINGGSSQSIISGTTCNYSYEGGSMTFTSPALSEYTAVNFASYGTPTGTCGNYLVSGCHATNSLQVAEDTLLGKSSATLNVNNGVFGDPCFGFGKSMYIQASHAQETTVGSLAPGNYTIVITDSIGCTATTVVTVSSTSGIHNAVAPQNLNLFPNPAKNNLTIEFTGVVYIYNSNGALIQQLQVNNSTQIDISSWTRGMYMINAIDKNGNHSANTLIKE